MAAAKAKKSVAQTGNSPVMANMYSPGRANVRKAIEAIQKATEQKPVAKSLSTQPFTPSGSVTIDNLIGGSMNKEGSGQVCPGYPRQRITELYGAESCGKTTAAIAAAVAVQRAGGVVMYIDFEHTLHHGYAQACGLSFDEDQLLLYQPTTLEEGLRMMYLAIHTGIDLVVVDSVAAMVPQAELEKKLGDNAKIGAVAKALAESLPKIGIWATKRIPLEDENGKAIVVPARTAFIFINQTRALINTGGHSAETESTSGGKALKFYASIRLKMTRVRSDFIEQKDPLTLKKKRIPYGNLVQIKVVKNKLDAKQGMTGEVFIRYGYGIDDVHSLIEMAVPRRIVEKSGASYVFKGEKYVGKEKLRKMLISNPSLLDALRSEVVKALMDAAPEPLSPDEIDEGAIVSTSDSLVDDLDSEMGDDSGPTEELVEETPEA